MARRVGAPPGRRRIRWRLAAAGAGGAVVLLAAVLLSGQRATPPADRTYGAAGSASAGPSFVALAPALVVSPSPSISQQSPVPIPRGAFAGDLLIADRGNGRILIVDAQRQILWRFPVAGSLPPGQSFSADDAFLSPDGRTISANEEMRQVLVRIDIATHRIVWEYGHYGRAGAGAGYLNTPDDAYPLPNGDVTVADIFNCRVLEIAPDKQVVRQWGHTGVCRDAPPYSYDEPNGDTPLADGGLLITEIRGSRVVRLDAAGRVVFDIHVPVSYPSDAQLDGAGNVIVADYAAPGGIVKVSPTGHLLWRYTPASGAGRLDHPSLAVPLSDGTILLNDDFRHRVIIIDPRTDTIVWQYGRTDVPARSAGQLNTPDGINLVPAGSIVGI